MSRVLSRADLVNIANGSAILASGGGGPVGLIGPMVDRIFSVGTPTLAGLDEVGEDSLTVVIAGAGSPNSVKSQPVESSRKLTDACWQSFERFLASEGTPDYLVAVETGVVNTLLPFYVSAKSGVPVLDGAGGRRSVPLITLTSFALAEAPYPPLIISNGGTGEDGEDPDIIRIDVSTANKAQNPLMAIVSTASFSNSSGFVSWRIPGALIRKTLDPRSGLLPVIEPRTVSFTLRLGEVLAETIAAGGDVIEVVREHIGGTVLLRGTFTESSDQTSNGFDFSQALFQSSVPGDSTEIRIYAQNESLIAWSSRTPRPAAMGPDLICYIAADGTVFSNADLEDIKGKEIAIIGSPATRLYRDPTVVRSFLSLLSGMGYGGSYLPLRGGSDSDMSDGGTSDGRSDGGIIAMPSRQELDAHHHTLRHYFKRH
jgi:DUF917 family protein